jgi:hypothetical protein
MRNAPRARVSRSLARSLAHRSVIPLREFQAALHRPRPRPPPPASSALLQFRFAWRLVPLISVAVRFSIAPSLCLLVLCCRDGGRVAPAVQIGV